MKETQKPFLGPELGNVAQGRGIAGGTKFTKFKVEEGDVIKSCDFLFTCSASDN